MSMSVPAPESESSRVLDSRSVTNAPSMMLARSPAAVGCATAASGSHNAVEATPERR
jgi:hypothetical protein